MKIRISEEDNNYLTREVKDLDTGRVIDLPHGSGIDGRWGIDDKGSYYGCYNGFHCINENGFYEGWQHFQLIVPKKKPNEFKIHFTGGQYLAQKHMLRDYLEDLFAMTFLDLKEGLKYSSVRTEENDMYIVVNMTKGPALTMRNELYIMGEEPCTHETVEDAVRDILVDAMNEGQHTITTARIHKLVPVSLEEIRNAIKKIEAEEEGEE